MGSPEHFDQAKQIPVVSCVNILVDTYCVLKSMSGKNLLLHLIIGTPLKVKNVILCDLWLMDF